MDGLGGTCKTYLYHALIVSVKAKRSIILVTTTSRIVATLLLGGWIAYSRFKILINPNASSICSVSKQLDIAKLLRHAVAII